MLNWEFLFTALRSVIGKTTLENSLAIFTKFKIFIYNGPVIPLQGIHLSEMHFMCIKVCTRMSLSVLFIIIQTGKNPNVHLHE